MTSTSFVKTKSLLYKSSDKIHSLVKDIYKYTKEGVNTRKRGGILDQTTTI